MQKRWYKLEGQDHSEAIFGTAKVAQRRVQALHSHGVSATLRRVKNRAEQRECAELAA
jgi:hypothetical protein